MTKLNKPLLAGHLLDALYWSIREGKKIDNIPGLLQQLIAEDIWKEVYVEETERVVTYESFEAFVTTPPPEGVGIKVKDLQRLLGNNTTMLDLLDSAVQGKPGGPLKDKKVLQEKLDSSSNIKKPKTTGRQAAIYRLRKDRPDLLQKVLDKEMTVNQAMIEAGFRKKRLMVYAQVDEVAKALKQEFTRKELSRIIELLQK